MSSGCADEPVTVVTTLTPTITTIQQPASSVVGKAIADQATVTTGGLTIPTGTVTFNLYDNAVCSGTPLFTDTESVHSVFAGVYATSAPYTTTSSGTFYWVATYNGDTYDSSVSSSCGAEPVMVTGATGAPEFPLGSLGPLLLIALLLPALVVLGKKFGARQPV